jgi:hypothetical protein
MYILKKKVYFPIMSQYILTIVENSKYSLACIPMQYLFDSREAAIEKARFWINTMITTLYKIKDVAVKLSRTKEDVDMLIEVDPMAAWELISGRLQLHHQLFILPVPKIKAPETIEDFIKPLNVMFEITYKNQFFPQIHNKKKIIFQLNHVKIWIPWFV